MKFKALLLTMVAVSATMSAAPIVQYTTTGVFGSSGTAISTSSSGLSTVTFLSGSGGPINIGFGTANVSFGQFDLSSSQAAGLDVLDDTFTLTIQQLSPIPGSAPLGATLTGNVRVDFTNAIVQFLTLDAFIGGVQYHIANAGNGVPGRVLIPTPTVNSGVGLSSVTIQGQISGSEVPEPGTYALMGLGLTAVSVLRRRFSW
jgi:hypothetical protein